MIARATLIFLGYARNAVCASTGSIAGLTQKPSMFEAIQRVARIHLNDHNAPGLKVIMYMVSDCWKRGFSSTPKDQATQLPSLGDIYGGHALGL